MAEETNPLLEDAGISTMPPETPPETAPVEGTPEVAADAAPEVASEAVVDEKKPDDIAVRAQSLVRKESALVQREQKLKQQERDFASAQQAVKDLESLKSLAANPLELLAKFGVNLDAVKAQIAEADSTDPTAKLARKVAELEKQRADDAAQAKRDADARQVDANVAKHRSELSSFAQANAEKFELVSAYGESAIALAQDTVIRHLKATTEAGTPELMTHERALQLVEDYLDKKYAQPALTTKKVLGRIKPVEAPAPVESKSITNDLVAEKTVSDDADAKRADESNDEYFERLLRKIG